MNTVTKYFHVQNYFIVSNDYQVNARFTSMLKHKQVLFYLFIYI